MLTRIHVNQHVIRANRKNGTNDPPLTVKTYRGNTAAREVVIRGPSRVVYRPDDPLSCGARVWIECDGDVEVIHWPPDPSGGLFLSKSSTATVDLMYLADYYCSVIYNTPAGDHHEGP